MISKSCFFFRPTSTNPKQKLPLYTYLYEKAEMPADKEEKAMRRKNRVAGFGVVMAILVLTSCGEVPTAQESSPQNAEVHVEENGGQISEEDEAGKDADENPGTEEIDEVETESTDIRTESFKSAANIEETVLVDENDIKITATELNYTDYSVELGLLIENNSSVNLSFTSGTLGCDRNAVNGYMVGDGYLNADVSAGKKSHESISFSKDALALFGITEVANIQIGFSVQDDDYEDFYTGMGQVNTSATDSYDYEDSNYQKSIKSGIWETAYNCSIDYYAEEELYNQNDIRVVSEALLTNKDGEKIILIEIVNDSQEMIYGVASEITVNGLIVNASNWSAEAINPGTRRVIDMPISSMLDKVYWPVFGIQEIGEFTFSFAVENAAHEEIAASEEIRIGISGEAAAVDDSGEELYSDNGIRIISKGLFEDPREYSDDIHLMLLVENQSSEAVFIDEEYGSLSVNGFMTECSAYRGDAVPGKYAIVDVTMRGSSLEENKIAEIEEITNIEITLEIRNLQYGTVDKPTIAVEY